MPSAYSAATLMPYLRLGVQTLPRCLGQVDRRAGSTTFGCCDVGHWRYRTHDISNARLQEMAWLGALVYANPLPGGARYYRNANLRAWVLGMATFWTQRQHRDGSVPEVYPNERSFCATSFSTLAMTEVWRLLELDAATDQATSTIRAGILRGAGWLASHDKWTIANQTAAAATALWNAHTIDPTAGFGAAAGNKVGALLAAQMPDGGFAEYGGTDYGYQSITLSVLAHLLTRWQPDGLRAEVERGGALLEAVVDERGLYDNRTTSRQTQFLYPAGLVRLGLPCVTRHLAGIERDEVITPQWMDDRYCIALATDYVLAYLAGGEGGG